MAGMQRFTKSTLDWAKFARRIPSKERQKFQEFKGRYEKYVAEVNRYPAQSPQINWAQYRATALNPTLVDQLQKQYEALQIPYPKDTITTEVDKLAKQSDVDNAKVQQELVVKHKESEQLLGKWRQLKPFENMTNQELCEAFPKLSVNLRDRPIDRTNMMHDYGINFQYWLIEKLIHDATELEKQLADTKKELAEIEKGE